ncbi:MAG TPA: hypothetical protein VJH33_00260 [Candidatus Paceibacterota bacterium]
MVQQKGKLIVLDGSDGVGKRTQTELLVTRLKKEGIRVKTMDFPQYEKNFFGRLLRRCLAGEFGNFIALDPHLASILYAGDRFESKKPLDQWLSSGYTVVLDRYVSANQMHQGGKIKNPRERARFFAWLDRLEHGALGIPRPSLVLYLHLPVRLSTSLLNNRKRTNARKTLDLAERNQKHLAEAQNAALRLLRKNPQWKKITCFDTRGVLSRDTIHEAVYRAVRKII